MRRDRGIAKREDVRVAFFELQDLRESDNKIEERYTIRGHNQTDQMIL